jgi:hypothetical protein
LLIPLHLTLNTYHGSGAL